VEERKTTLLLNDTVCVPTLTIEEPRGVACWWTPDIDMGTGSGSCTSVAEGAMADCGISEFLLLSVVRELEDCGRDRSVCNVEPVFCPSVTGIPVLAGVGLVSEGDSEKGLGWASVAGDTVFAGVGMALKGDSEPDTSIEDPSCDAVGLG
jgi:hypothetical protein